MNRDLAAGFKLDGGLVFENANLLHLRNFGNHWAVVVASLIRLGDLIDFGQVFKAFGNN